MSRPIFLVLFAFALASASLSPLSSKNVKVSFSEIKSLKNKSTTDALGAVSPKQCGGVGRLDQMRVTGCNAFPCTVNFDTEIELDFTPANNAIAPIARLSLTANDLPEPISFDQPMRNPLVAGQTQTYKVEIEFELPKTPAILADMEAKIEIIGDQNRVEICASGEFNLGADFGGFANGLSASSLLVMAASLLLGLAEQL